MIITHESMMALTADMPMKQIVINGEVYLERYFAHTLPAGTQVWYHRFLRNDSERHLHSHPWESDSTILLGLYAEESLSGGEKVKITFLPGMTNHIRKWTIHRIVQVAANTWTQMIVRPGRDEQWYFIDDNGDEQAMQTSLFEWHQDCKPRGSQS